MCESSVKKSIFFVVSTSPRALLAAASRVWTMECGGWLAFSRRTNGDASNNPAHKREEWNHWMKSHKNNR
jgi:hypothetical protein